MTEMGCTSTGAQITSISVAHQCASSSTDGPQFHGKTDEQGTGSSEALLAYKNAPQNLSSSALKADLELLKVTMSQWKQVKKMRAGTAVMYVSNNHSCKRSPLDQLAALVLRGYTRQRHIDQEYQQAPLYSTKPQNCKRIVVLGAPRVGKTSILRRYLLDGFVEEYNPTSEDFLRKLFRIRGQTYQIDILDASKERDFPAKRRLSILTGDIFLLVFSIDDRSSFEEVCALKTEILAAKSKLTKPSASGESAPPQVPLVVCANKVDLQEAERGLKKTEVLRALGKDCAYFETSAKDSTNLEMVFEALAKRGGLPSETGPSQHRKVSIRSYQSMRKCCVPVGGSQTPGRDDPCGAMYPLIRRPSFSTDLRQVIGPQTVGKSRKLGAKCQIQ